MVTGRAAAQEHAVDFRGPIAFLGAQLDEVQQALGKSADLNLVLTENLARAEARLEDANRQLATTEGKLAIAEQRVGALEAEMTRKVDALQAQLSERDQQHQLEVAVCRGRIIALETKEQVEKQRARPKLIARLSSLLVGGIGAAQLKSVGVAVLATPTAAELTMAIMGFALMVAAAIVLIANEK